MGSPGIPMRLKNVASVVGASAAAEHESAYPALVTQMGAGSAGPRWGQSDDAPKDTSRSAAPAPPSRGATPGASGTGGAPGPGGRPPEGPGTSKAPATGPEEPPAETTSEPGSSGKTLRDRRRAGRPRRGRPRSTHADRVILVAAAEVMAEKGIGGLSIEEVALRAGVGKTTIYRRWSSRGTLALDAFLAEFDGQQGLPDTGTFAGDLRAALGAWVRAVSGTSAGTMLVGLIAEMQHDRNLAVGWRDQVIAPLRAQYSIICDRGVSRGEIPAETDAGIVLDLLFGACYYRLLQGQRRLNEQFVNQIVDVVAAGVGARTDLSAPIM